MQAFAQLLVRSLTLSRTLVSLLHFSLYDCNPFACFNCEFGPFHSSSVPLGQGFLTWVSWTPKVRVLKLFAVADPSLHTETGLSNQKEALHLAVYVSGKGLMLPSCSFTIQQTI